MTRIVAATLLSCLMLSTAQAQPPTPSAPPQDGNRLVGYLALAFGGEARLHGGGSRFDADLDPSVGLGIRYEILINDLFSIAPMLEWLSYRFDARDANREHVLDFDVFLKFRGILHVKSVDIELYGGVPFGFSILTQDRADSAFGFNLGVMGGAAVFFGKFGLMLELGWRMHHGWEGDFRVSSNQAAMNLGAILRL